MNTFMRFIRSHSHRMEKRSDTPLTSLSSVRIPLREAPSDLLNAEKPIPWFVEAERHRETDLAISARSQDCAVEVTVGIADGDLAADRAYQLGIGRQDG